MKKNVLGIFLFCVALFCGIETGIAQNDDDMNKLRTSLKNYTEDTNPKNANCTFSELLKDPDEASGKKAVGKFYVKLKKYTDPNDDNNYTDEPIDESAKPSYLLIPKNSSKYSSKRYFQIFEGEHDKETYKNLAVGSTVTLYVMVMSGALPFDEKHTITKLYFMAKIK